MKKKNELVIVFFSVLLIALVAGTNIFGSTMDFLSQHVVFANYLRKLFYSSGKIIPSLAVHLGSGQNIFNIAYYGLLNPIILISYLFPFIKMIDYIVISNVVLFVLSNLFFYRFIKNKFDNSLFLTFLFMFSGSLLFQFHRQFMFVNYMPFLILALINIDKGKMINFVIDVFLIIMISFYYSIPSIIVILIYYIYINFESFKIKNFFKFLGYIFLSILMSSILLFPTFSAIVSSRISNFSFDFSLFFPSFDLDNMLYGPYSVGLTSICFISVLYLFFSKNKKNIFLGSIICILFFIPIFMFALNGGLYVRGKVLIPFLPILVFVIGLFFKNIDSIDLKKFLIFVLIINLFVFINYRVYLYYLDLVFILVLLFFKNKKVIYFLTVVVSFVICFYFNSTDKLLSNNLLDDLDYSFKSNDFYRVSNLKYNDYTVNMNNGNYISSIYSSINNKYYSYLYHDIFKVNNSQINNLSLASTSNVLYNEFIANKYVIGENLPYPYRLVSDGVYVLDQALPIGYVSYNSVNSEYYDSLEYPYNLDILLNYVVDSNSNSYVKSNIEEVKLDYSYVLGPNISIKDDKLYASSDSYISVSISEDLSDKILFISLYDQVAQDYNISMSINGQNNVLTKSSWIYPNNNTVFYYCISGNSILDIQVSKGIYNIGNIKTYVLDNSYIVNQDIDEFNIDVMDSEVIKGRINVSHDGVFVLKVPYDKGFKIFVNGAIMDYRMVDEAFIGFDLSKGVYDIEIYYEPPYLKLGCVFSIIGACLFLELIRRSKV